MKKTICIFVITLLIMAGCGGDKQSTYDFITVDVTKKYPDKELILQDFMDVEYIKLETTDDFLTQGVVRAVGKDIILIANRNMDGDIFIYDIIGKALRKINRKGQGGEEYTQATQIILDEDANEMFVIDYPLRKLLVYDLFGNFKRSFKFTGNGYYTYVFNYDQNNLICYNRYLSTENEKPCYLIVSKQDGSILQKIQIPFEDIKRPIITAEMNGEVATITLPFCQIIPFKGDYVIAEASSDTVYIYLPDGSTSPFILRTPSIHTDMDPEVLICPNMITDRYYFMQSQKKQFDFQRMRTGPVTYLVYDKQDKVIYQHIVLNDDYSIKKQVDLNWSLTSFANHEIATCITLEAHRLVESYNKGELKDSKLKEIASKLDEEDNPVIMLVKHKK